MEPFLSDPLSQREFEKILGGGVELMGDELVEDHETVLPRSKNFSALQPALHGSSELKRDKGSASRPVASQLLKPSPSYQKLSREQVPCRI